MKKEYISLLFMEEKAVIACILVLLLIDTCAESLVPRTDKGNHTHAAVGPGSLEAEDFLSAVWPRIELNRSGRFIIIQVRP